MYSILPGRWALAALFCLVAVALPSGDVHADESAPAAVAEDAARGEFDAGRAAYEAGEFGRARAHFEQAYALSARPPLLFNIGRAADSDGDAAAAVAAYERYLALEPSAENAAFVQARLGRLRASRGAAATMDAPPVSAASPASSGQLAVTLAPTPASLQNAAPLRPERSLPREERRAWYRSPWLWTAVGALVVGASVGTVLAVRGGDENVSESYGGNTGTVLLGPSGGSNR